MADSRNMRSPTRRPESGSIVITAMLAVSLLGGGAVLVRMQLASTQSVAVTRSKITGNACAEAGLAAARAAVTNNYGLWGPALCAGSCVVGSTASEPSFLASIDHDLDNDGTADFVITLVDNDDETPVSDKTKDNDLQVYVVSTCLIDPSVRVQVSELVEFTPPGNTYDSQAGGVMGYGNSK
jgi:hypothetical protein